MWVARRRRSLLFRLSGRGLLALVLWYCKCYFEGWYTVYNKTCFEGGVPGRRLLGGAEDALCHPLAPFKFLKSIIFNSIHEKILVIKLQCLDITCFMLWKSIFFGPHLLVCLIFVICLFVCLFDLLACKVCRDFHFKLLLHTVILI